MGEVYIRNTEAIISPQNALAFLIDYFQAVKEEESSVVLHANRAIGALHGVQKDLEEIKKTLSPRIG